MSNMTLNRNDSESITAHFSGGTEKHFSKGEVIVMGTEKPSGVYLILEGFVKAYSISPQGQESLLLIHGANEIMPLPWALDGPQKVGIYYEAISPVATLRTSKDYLRSSMGKNPWLSEQILRQLVNTFTIYAQRIQNLGYRLPRQRAIACLLDLATRFGQKDGHTIVISAPITHQDVADSTNMTRETASRSLEGLAEDGFVVQKDHAFVIIDERKMQKELG